MPRVGGRQWTNWLKIETPLGGGETAVGDLTGVEGISRLFEFTVTILSPNLGIEPKDLLGKSVTLTMGRENIETPRYVNGIVTSFSGGFVTRRNPSTGHQRRAYRLTISPALWALDRDADYKVFQKKSVKDIAEEILGDAGVTFAMSLNAAYDKREYCVQFGETDLAFLERLFAEEGIFYFFKHEQGSHTLVIADAATAYTDCARSELEFLPEYQDRPGAVYILDVGASLNDAKWALRDYNFETPTATLEGTTKTTLQPSGSKSWEQFHYPARSLVPATLARLAKVGIEAAEAGAVVTHGRTACVNFTPGQKFTISKHPAPSEEGKAYVLTEVRHEARDIDISDYAPRRGPQPADADADQFYRSIFTCIPSDLPARQPLPTTKPLARGPMTALVVGTSGQEIETDKYGRIRIQFPWDRLGKKNETSSCFVHVAQPLAGSGWGAVFLPRIGMEVVVHFLDGDPDRPLVTGAVYNGTNGPPWTLPDNKTKSGLLTRSSTGGQAANANELSFEDKKGEELILFHAEKDFTREVENDDKLDVGHDQTRTVKNNRTTTIKEGSDTLTISKGNRTETISEGNEALTISKGNRTVDITQGNDTLTLGQGNLSVTLTQGNRDTKLDTGNDTLTLAAGNHTTDAQAGKIILQAVQGITLKCGANTVEITQQGVSINGVEVKIAGQAKTTVGAPMVEVSGDGMTTIKGGMVKIN